MLGKTWKVFYGTASVPSKNEFDVKLLARELVRKGHQVRAETQDNPGPVRVIKPHHIPAWLDEI